jgi:hypothetical protein
MLSREKLLRESKFFSSQEFKHICQLKKLIQEYKPH